MNMERNAALTSIITSITTSIIMSITTSIIMSITMNTTTRG